MSDEGKRVVPVPGGMKLLSNVEETGQTLMEGAELAPYLSREQLIQVLEGHGRIGEVMVEAVGRCRKTMELGT